MLALVLTVIFGIIFGHYEQWFYIGAATIIFGVAIGPLIDLFKNSVYKILEAIK
jgi:lipoprotein signal peptidase